jgi:hypothetical protein
MNTTTSPAPALPDSDPRSPANVERRRTLKLAERDPLGRLYPGSVLERAGRPVGPTVTTLARQFTAEAVACLAGVMEDTRAPQAARVTAAVALLDRGWGKAPISVDLNVRQKFDDFLREIGVAAKAERELIEAESVNTDE